MALHLVALHLVALHLVAKPRQHVAVGVNPRIRQHKPVSREAAVAKACRFLAVDGGTQFCIAMSSIAPRIWHYFLAAAFLATDFFAAPLVAVLDLVLVLVAALRLAPLVMGCAFFLLGVAAAATADLPLVATAFLPTAVLVATVFLAVAVFGATALLSFFAAALAGVAVAVALALLRFLPPKADSQPDA